MLVRHSPWLLNSKLHSFLAFLHSMELSCQLAVPDDLLFDLLDIDGDLWIRRWSAPFLLFIARISPLSLETIRGEGA